MNSPLREEAFDSYLKLAKELRAFEDCKYYVLFVYTKTHLEKFIVYS